VKVVRYYPRALNGDGGMTAAVHSWSRAAAMLGAQVSILYDEAPSHGPTPPVEGVTLRAIKHRRVGGLSMPVAFAESLRGADVLVLHSGWTSHNLVAAAIARRLGIPYVLEPRGAYDPHIIRRRFRTKTLWWHAAERRMVSKSLAVHVFFSSEREHLARLGYRGQVIVAPNGVHVPPGQKWDGGSGGYLLWLGRFDPEHKGLDLLLDAMATIPAELRPLLRLHGPDWRGRKQHVVEMVAARGLRDSVLIGRAVRGEEKRELQLRARAFVYPSRWEAFGNSVAEVAALGVPVLTTRYPLGVFLEERDAAVACESNPPALAVGIENVLAPGAASLGAQARNVVESELRWESVAESWLAQVTPLLRSTRSTDRW
jgi:glycosyltransferase involved in cell wall biosynthesis